MKSDIVLEHVQALRHFGGGSAPACSSDVDDSGQQGILACHHNGQKPTGRPTPAPGTWHPRTMQMLAGHMPHRIIPVMFIE
ncbi:hypothetical protein PG996_014102 [Apiospora saccharicola]|uniref:Uncharacterized protein n=1 Tax=Apiospora saccharicola TaxID=335842 RepID=A0ABR1TK53_9PEZI